MKKLGIVAALALVTTIGGVYATWNYAGTKVTTVSHEKTISITDSDTTTVHGEVHVHADTLTLSIDDVGSSNKTDGITDYTPGWNPAINDSNGGVLAIDFLPKAGAPDTVEFEYTITITGNKYEDDVHSWQPIFKKVGATTIDNNDYDGTGTIVVATTKKWKEASLSSSCSGAYVIDSWTLSQFQELLVVNDAFTVSTLEEYGKYKTALAGVKITVTVTDVTGSTPAQQQ